jgi:hypothetical protein
LLDGELAAQKGGRREPEGATSMVHGKINDTLRQIADILGAGILRLHLRDVRKLLKKNGKSETGLEVSTGVIPCRLEPKQRGERR